MSLGRFLQHINRGKCLRLFPIPGKVLVSGSFQHTSFLWLIGFYNSEELVYYVSFLILQFSPDLPSSQTPTPVGLFYLPYPILESYPVNLRTSRVWEVEGGWGRWWYNSVETSNHCWHFTRSYSTTRCHGGFVSTYHISLFGGIKRTWPTEGQGWSGDQRERRLYDRVGEWDPIESESQVGRDDLEDHPVWLNRELSTVSRPVPSETGGRIWSTRTGRDRRKLSSSPGNPLETLSYSLITLEGHF